jgi:hypothetical protein
MTRRELHDRVCLLSSARRQRHGVIPDDAGVWWQQIEALALEFALPITWEEWHSITRRRHDEQEELPL